VRKLPLSAIATVLTGFPKPKQPQSFPLGKALALVREAPLLLFGLMLHAASIAMWVLVAVQFIFTLITGSDNRNLRSLGKSMTLFISQALEYLTYNTEQKPFPFADWPDGGCSTPDEKSLTTPDQNNQPEQHP